LILANELRVSPAEISPAKNDSTQVVVACVAAHWFDLPAFLKEADRVLCQNGVVALTSFFLPIAVHPTKSDELNDAIRHVSFKAHTLQYLTIIFLSIHIDVSFILKASVRIGAAESVTWKMNTATLQSLTRKLCGKNQHIIRLHI
jgi:ubiquinone/menaquinone biosynthesis C-methylase UbiE